MSLVTQTYPPPTEGVSQQPDDRRRNNQVEDLVNAVCDPIRGLQKRPPTVFLGVWENGNGLNTMGSFENAHVINRSDDEQYIVTFHNSTEAPIRVFDFDGNEYKVNYETGLQTAAIQYILEGRTDIKPPNKYLKAVTIADYTIICNPNVMTSLTDDRSPALSPQALVFTRGSMLSPCAYGITSRRESGDQSLAWFSVGYVGWWTTFTSLAALYFGQNAGKASVSTALNWSRAGEYYVMPNYAGGMAVINRRDADESIVISDHAGDGTLKAINNEVASIDDLPNLAPDGYRVRVRSYDGGELSDYWLQYKAGSRNWIETIAPDLQYKINAQTMPWALVRQADGTFLVTTIDWHDRKTGDDDSNPVPSFIDETISNIFFYRNRLGFISGENVILSEASEFFSFWYDSAVDVLSTDPIDESVPSTSVMRLRHAIPMETDIVLFANDAEYLMRAEGVLSPTNIAVDFLSSYAYDVNVSPINIGNDVYFVNRGGSYSSLYRYTTLTDSYYQKYGDDVSQHVPYYIPNSVRQLIGNTGENFLALLTDDENELNSIYIYKYIVGEDRQFRQQAWSKWKFNDYYKVMFITYINNYLYIQLQVDATNDSDATVYEWHRLEFGGNALDLDIEKEMEYHRVYTDRKIVFTIDENNSVYDENTDTTTIDLWKVYPNDVNGEYWVVASAIEEEIKDIPIQSLKISPQKYFMTEGDMQILTAVLTPSDTTETNVAWTISDSETATLTSNGLNAFIAAHKAGEVEIKCASADGLYGVEDTIIIEIDEVVVEYENVEINIMANTANLVVRDHLSSLGYTINEINTLPFNITININAGVYLYSIDNGLPSLSVSNLNQRSIVTVNNLGFIVGAGGTGGNAMDSDEGDLNGSNNGGNGGTAIRAIGAFTFNVNNSGSSDDAITISYIFGGGGGGGSVSINKYDNVGSQYFQLQAAGGGGAGYGIAGTTQSTAGSTGRTGRWSAATDGTLLDMGQGGGVSDALISLDETEKINLQGGTGGQMGDSGAPPNSLNSDISERIFTTGGAGGHGIVASTAIALTITTWDSGAIGTIIRD